MTGSLRHQRPLDGVALGLSVSESDETPGLGITPREVNRAVRDVASAVLGQGGQVVFGHDWREGGVMEAVLALAIDYQDSTRQNDATSAAMTNFVPWPNRSTVSPEDRRRYDGVLDIVESGAPDVPTGATLPPGPAAEPILRVLALTEMRRMMVQRCDARLCIGGRTTGFQGRVSGIIEEAALTVEAGRPLYVSDLFGGASGEIVRALTGRPYATPEVVQPGPALARTLAAADLNPAAAGVDAGGYDHTLRTATPDALADRNGLTTEENEQLFHARSLTEVIGLVLKGLSNLPR